MRCAKARIPAFILAMTALCAFAACGGSGSSRTSGGGSGNNAQPIVVNSGPMGNYANGVFATVNVCAPGTSNCQSISGVPERFEHMEYTREQRNARSVGAINVH